MNWGKGIAIVIVLFMGFIVSFVYRAFQRDADLVREDYYEYELEFDDNQNSRKNYATMEEKITIDKMEEGVCLLFPASVNNIESGSIDFYRPDAKKYDRRFDLQLDTANSQILEYSHFREGLYEVTVRWKDSEKTYIFEQEISF